MKARAKAGADVDSSVQVSVRNSPRARASVQRSRALGALIGLLFGCWVGYQHTAEPFAAGVGALGGWLVGGLLFWWAGIVIWQQVLGLEVEDRRREMMELVEQQRPRPQIIGAGEEPKGDPQ